MLLKYACPSVVTRQPRRTPQRWRWSPCDVENPHRHTHTTTVITKTPKTPESRNANPSLLTRSASPALYHFQSPATALVSLPEADSKRYLALLPNPPTRYTERTDARSTLSGTDTLPRPPMKLYHPRKSTTPGPFTTSASNSGLERLRWSISPLWSLATRGEETWIAGEGA